MKTVRVPDRFKGEVASSDSTEIRNLQEDIIKFRGDGLKDDEILAILVEAGWSSEFAGWFTDEVDQNGLDFGLIVSSETDSTYARRTGLVYLILGLIAFFGSGATMYINGVIGRANAALLNLLLSIGGLVMIGIGIWRLITKR